MARQRRLPMKVARDAIVPGVKFDTPFEQGCVVTSALDEIDNFYAFDSDGVEVEYSGEMVERIYNTCTSCAKIVASGDYCQICKRDYCPNCLTNHSHGMDK